jgi:hypothetical protein
MSDSLPPSMLNSVGSYLPNHFWSWLVVSLIIFGLIYTAFKINGEKKQFLQDGKWMTWQYFEFFIPAWWTQDITFQEGLRFMRADTHYDWYFEISKDESSSATQAKDKYLLNEKIQLDPDAVYTTEKTYLLKNEPLLAKVEDFFRVESTATENETDRIYLDGVWIKLKDDYTLQLISKSSVLNGGIEGPYFEEVVKEIKFK